MNNITDLTGYPGLHKQITYYDILTHLGDDVVRLFFIFGVAVLLYSLVNIFVNRDKILVKIEFLEMKVADIDFFMLIAGIYFTLLGAVYYFRLPIS